MPSATEDPYILVGPFDADGVKAELMTICQACFPAFNKDDLAATFDDISRLFDGLWPGYKASNTAYHDLEHTQAVVLACARLMHGAILCGEPLTEREYHLGLMAAFFHDAGLIQTTDDTSGTGAKHTRGHERRSIRMAAVYLREHGFSEEDVVDCGHVIESTILAMPVQGVPFRDPRTALLGRILAAGDLHAQMADWAYLEKLALLFKEFEEASIPGFDSEIMLLEKTQGFYDFVVKKRLESLGEISDFMRAHYRERHAVDRDPYHEATLANLDFLRRIMESSHNNAGLRLESKGFEWSTNA